METYEDIQRTLRIKNLVYWILLPGRERVAGIKVVIKEGKNETDKSNKLS